MPLIEEMDPVPRKVKPLFILVEITPSAEQNSRAKEFLERLLDRVYSVSKKNADFELLVGLYPFGTNCNSNPSFFRNCEEIDFESLFGDDEATFKETILLLNGDLSSKNKLQSTIGCYLPTIYLISNCEPTCIKVSDLSSINTNRWFRAAKRWVISYSKLADNEFALAFAELPPGALWEVDRDYHVRELSLDCDIDTYIGNLIYNTYLMPGIVPTAMFASGGITGSFMDSPYELDTLVKVDPINEDEGQEIITMGVIADPLLGDLIEIEDPAPVDSAPDDNMGWDTNEW